MSSSNIALKIVKLNKSIEKDINRILEDVKISYPEWLVMGVIKNKGGLRINDIAIEYGVDSPFITSIINSLDEKNLIKKTDNKEDARSKIISLTLKARKIMTASEAKVKKSTTMSHLSATFLKQLEKIKSPDRDML